MRTFLTLAWREIAERRLLLLASACLGLVPVVLPFVPAAAQRSTPEELRAATLIVLALLFGGATLLILGATVVGRDLSEGRLSFYFSRPVPSWTLWGSRLAAACALVLASLALLAGPTAVFDLGSWLEDIAQRPRGHAWPLMAPGEVFFAGVSVETLPASPPRAVKLAYGLGAILLLLAATHAVSTIVRARSVWLLADLGGLAAVAGLGWVAHDVLVREQALGALVWAQWLLLPWILAALLLAGGRQLARGRTDLRRGHRVLSATLWPLLIAGALAFGAYARWVAGSTLDDLEVASYLGASANEDWLLAGGPVRGRAGAGAAFLLDVESGDSWRLGSLGVVQAWHAFSEDGGTLAWARCDSFQPPDCRVWAKDLRDRPSPPRDTGIPIAEGSHQWALSGDGSRLAMSGAGKITVYELSSASLLTALKQEQAEDVDFVSNDRVRYHQAVELEDASFKTRIREIDLAERESVTTGWLPRGLVIRRSPERDAVLFRRAFPSGFGLYDGKTGEPLLTLDERWRQFPSRGRFLADGRVVLSLHETDRVTLLVLSPEGEEQHHIERPATNSRLGGELAPGRLMVALRRTGTDPDPAAWSTYQLDADSGELSPLIDGAMPLGGSRASLERRLFWTLDGQVFTWRPATGERRTLLPVAE